MGNLGNLFRSRPWLHVHAHFRSMANQTNHKFRAIRQVELHGAISVSSWLAVCVQSETPGLGRNRMIVRQRGTHQGASRQILVSEPFKSEGLQTSTLVL